MVNLMQYIFGANKLLILFILCIFLINGCSQKAQLPCPKAMVLSEASSLTTFMPGDGRDITDIETETTIERVVRGCSYKNSTVSVITSIKFESTKGANYKKNKKDLKFFVAVIDKEENIVGKEIFNLEMPYIKNSRKSQLVDNIEQIIPIKSGLRGLDYTVLVGFQLEPLELIYNKQQRKSGKIKRLP